LNSSLTFNIIDAPMGAGKTTAIINMINANTDTNKRFIVCTPYITECERIAKATGAKTPFGKKKECFMEYLKGTENIVCTHKLCDLFDDGIRDILKQSKQKNILVIDETPNLIKNIVGSRHLASKDDSAFVDRFSSGDIALIQNAGLIYLSDDCSRVCWNNDNDYNKPDNIGVFASIKRYAETCDLYNYGASKDISKINSIIALTKQELFTWFDEVWIFSYMVKGSLLDNYCQLNKIDISYYHIENSQDIIQGYKFEYPPNLDRLEVIHDDKLNFNNWKPSLAKNWYIQQKIKKTNKELDILKKRARACKDKYKGKNEPYYWTTFTDNIDDIVSKNIAKKCFIPCNQKAKNDLKNCTFVMYLCNRFINPNISNWLQSVGLSFDDDLYALSELIQFVYRSNLRVSESDKKVSVYVPSFRMRGLLDDYIQDSKMYKTVKEVA
jgi:hypothetical protein